MVSKLGTDAILLIEDDIADIEILKRHLHAAMPARPISIESAATLSDGLIRLSERPYVLIILDLNLPDSNGVLSFERVFQASPETPILVISGSTDRLLGQQLIALGAQELLAKHELSSAIVERKLMYALQRKRASAYLRQQVESETVRWIVESMAQDFNGLLAAVLDQLQTMQTSLKDMPASLAQLRTASNLALRGTDLTHQLFELARQDSEADACAVAQAVREATRYFADLVGPGVTVETDLDTSHWSVELSAGQLRVILNTLLSNCIASGERSRVIHIRCLDTHVEHSGLLRDQRIVAGEYVQIDCLNSKRQPVGEDAALTEMTDTLAGLGLELINGFVRKNGGAITRRHIDGVGDEITVLIPRASSRSSHPDVATLSRLQVRSKMIIVSGVSPQTRTDTGKRLAMLGYQTRLADSLNTALRDMRGQATIDVIAMPAQEINEQSIQQLSSMQEHSYDLGLLLIGAPKAQAKALLASLSLRYTSVTEQLDLIQLDTALRELLSPD